MRLRSVWATAMSAANNAVIAPTQVTAFSADETLAAFGCAVSCSPALGAASSPRAFAVAATVRSRDGDAEGWTTAEFRFALGISACDFTVAATAAAAGGITGCGAASING